MRQSFLSAMCGAALLPPVGAQSPSTNTDEAAWQIHRKTRVLYAGSPGGSREHAFQQFLSVWFDKVGVIDLEKLSMRTAGDYDVVIADWRSQYGNDGYPKRENELSMPGVGIGPEFTKPVIAMDYVSSSLRMEYKLDWL
ncbi:MAG TPA: hypothetical protein VGR31_03410 [Planctomycetota bacterium]|nr:hypothetical protein [Planctomycetota bacterium]